MYLFQNALAVDPQNVSMLVLIVAAAVWGGVLLLLLVDVSSDSTLSWKLKIFWVPLILCVPFVSGLLYGAFSIIRCLSGTQRQK